MALATVRAAAAAASSRSIWPPASGRTSRPTSAPMPTNTTPDATSRSNSTSPLIPALSTLPTSACWSRATALIPGSLQPRPDHGQGHAPGGLRHCAAGAAAPHSLPQPTPRRRERRRNREAPARWPRAGPPPRPPSTTSPSPGSNGRGLDREQQRPDLQHDGQRQNVEQCQQHHRRAAARQLQHHRSRR